MIKTNSTSVCESPWIINIELCNACNLDCIFCDHSSLKKQMIIMEMEVQLLLKILSDIKECLTGKLYELGLAGLGEPTLDRYLEKHIEIINSHAYLFERISFNSNLVSLSRKSAELLLNSKINTYTFSINASNRTTYMKMMRRDKFEQVIDNLKLFVSLRKENNNEARIDVQIFESEDNNLKALKNRFNNYEQENINFFTRKVYSKPVIQKSIDLPFDHTTNITDRYPCWDIYTRIYIDVEGNLYPCTIGNDSYRETSNLFLGNIKNESLIDIFNNKENQNARERAEQGKLPYPECDLCNVWSLTPNNFLWDKDKAQWSKKEKQVRAYGLKE